MPKIDPRLNESESFMYQIVKPIKKVGTCLFILKLMTLIIIKCSQLSFTRAMILKKAISTMFLKTV